MGHARTHRTTVGICLAIALSVSAPATSQDNPVDAWWHQIESLCGQAFQGRLVSTDPADADLAAAPMTMHVRRCEPNRLEIPFHIGTDRSRTWVITRTGDALHLQHDHRHEDGESDEITLYGGVTHGTGSPTSQSFPADAYSIELFETHGLTASVVNVWTMEIVPDERFSYRLRRPGRQFQADFDLTRTVSPPPPPWGHEPLPGPDGEYGRLLTLFERWRAFEGRVGDDGVPDYTEPAMSRKATALRELRAELDAIDPSAWPVSRQVDYHLVRAEMNGLDFDLRVRKPWARDPAYYTQVWTYQSDTPAHEGPTNHALVELWTYELPLDADGEAKLTGELDTIPPLLAQARGNLVGNARELWMAGIGDLRSQADTLAGLANDVAEASTELRRAVDDAHQATLDFVAWLEAESTKKTGPSGLGKDEYTWSLQNVHLVPMTWEDEVRLLERELYRAHASLRLEEHRNRNLPPLDDISSVEEYAHRANDAVTDYLEFLEREEVLPIRPYMDEALRERIGRYVPPEERNFFHRAIHYEPMTLWTHFYHWWDLAEMEADPHPSLVRRGPLLNNIFDSRAEGMATGVEEMMMHAGLYDDNPRVREIVWIMLAQRAARGLGSLYAQANVFTLKEARDFHVAWTPRGWMREDLDLLGFEQLLYLRQPGYGTSYVTGKYLIEQLIAERSRQLGEEFSLSSFFAEVDALGVIPVSLIRWELTGDDSEIRALTDVE